MFTNLGLKMIAQHEMLNYVFLEHSGALLLNHIPLKCIKNLKLKELWGR